MACGMENGENDNRIRFQDVEDPVSESAGKNPANIRVGAKAGIKEGIFSSAMNRRAYLKEKIFP
jgi:hypothetical protein